MRELWQKISYLGLKDKENNLDLRLVILTNRLNFVMGILLIILFLFAVIIATQRKFPAFGLNNLSILLQVGVCLLVFLLSFKSRHNLSRFIISNFPVFVIFVLPVSLGVVEEENFFYFPYVIIVFGFLSQLLINIKNEKAVYLTSILGYGIMLVSAEPFMIKMGSKGLIIPGILEDFYIFNKSIQVSIYAFLSLSLYYIKGLNYKIEKELSKKNIKLDQQNEELQTIIENLKITQQQLVQSAKMASLGTLTSGIAHEINNPLNYILGGVDILKSSLRRLLKKIKINEETSPILDDLGLSSSMVIEGAERTSSIVNSLMSFSTRGESKIQKTDINKVVVDSILFLRSRIPRDVNVIEDYKVKKKVYVYPEKMHQVFLSIIDNAIFATIHFTDDVAKVIELKSYEENYNDRERAVIEIYNTGEHIQKDHLSRIFDPFFTTKEPDQGMGLGLSEAFNLLKEHNGEIAIKNVSGGVKLIVTLPI